MACFILKMNKNKAKIKLFQEDHKYKKIKLKVMELKIHKWLPRLGILFNFLKQFI